MWIMKHKEIKLLVIQFLEIVELYEIENDISTVVDKLATADE